MPHPFPFLFPTPQTLQAKLKREKETHLRTQSPQKSEETSSFNRRFFLFGRPVYYIPWCSMDKRLHSPSALSLPGWAGT